MVYTDEGASLQGVHRMDEGDHDAQERSRGKSSEHMLGGG